MKIRLTFFQRWQSFNPPPRRGRGGMICTASIWACVEVSIRRRVVDAAE